MGVKYNIGSGQRKFDTACGWINVDCQTRWSPDIVADGASLPMIDTGSVEMIVLHHVLEHYGCGESKGLIQECWRLLASGGKLLVFVPDLRALAQRWLLRQMDTQIYMTNLYGAFMGDEADRHRWGFDDEHLAAFLSQWPWQAVKAFDWRPVAGASLARDWWVLAKECVK